MEITDLTKDVRRLLLEHWSQTEIEDRLKDPEYFFEQLVIPRLNYLRQSDKDTPQLRLQRRPTGGLRIILR
jgi:hypothetical protein